MKGNANDNKRATRKAEGQNGRSEQHDYSEKYTRLTQSLIERYSTLKASTQTFDKELKAVIPESGEAGELLRSAMQKNATGKELVGYVDKALIELKGNMERAGTPEQYRALELIYLYGKKFDEAAVMLQCDQNTVRRWKNKAIKRLSVIIFGVSALNVDLSRIIETAAARQGALEEAETTE